jgi:HAD superfamily hydrolase (TIGR01509 family)
MDGVIADTEPLHAEAYLRTFHQYGISTTAQAYKDAVTLGTRRAIEFYYELGGAASKEEVFVNKDRHYASICETHLVPRPGVRELLKDLEDHGVTMVIATGSRREVTRQALRQMGILEYFSAVLAVEDTVRMKPDPEIYLSALKVTGAGAHEAVVIEDTPKGVLAARRAGVPAIAAPTELTAHEDFSLASLVVDSMEKLNYDVLSHVTSSGDQRP